LGISLLAAATAPADHNTNQLSVCMALLLAFRRLVKLQRAAATAPADLNSNQPTLCSHFLVAGVWGDHSAQQQLHQPCAAAPDHPAAGGGGAVPGPARHCNCNSNAQVSRTFPYAVYVVGRK
jgi:hypothetical protein